MAKETISQTEGLAKEAATNVRNAYDRGYKQGYKDGQAQQLASDDVFRESCEKSAYEKGLNDAWECARKVNDIDYAEKIFSETMSGILKHFTPSEAIAKIKEYEEKQKADEIKVGDEVYYKNPGDAGVVTNICKLSDDCTYISGFKSYGKFFSGGVKYHKTGRHFSQIAEVLEQLKGEK